MKKTIILPAIVLILLCGIESSFGQTIPEEAKRHFNRGMAVVEMAKSPKDYASAIEEFEKAARLAPKWPDVYFNLGMVQEKAERYRDAIESLKQYLRLAPNASDAVKVREHIYKLEYKAENVLTPSDIADVLVSFGKWQWTGHCNYPIFELIQRAGPDSVRVLTHYAYQSPPVRRFRTLKVDGPIIKFTTKDRNWSLGDDFLVSRLGQEGRPYDFHIEVVSRQHVIVKEKVTFHDGSSELSTCEYIKK
jgi:tetratricopeptide (TPR) repeat protein